MRKLFHTRWLLAALAAAALGPPEAAAQTAPRDTGLILSSMEAAVRVPVERRENLRVTIDLSDRKLYVTSGDEVIREYPVAVGEEGYDTPTGTFRIQRLIWNPGWIPPPSAWARDREPEPPGSLANPMGRVKMFFREPDYYIHGTYLAGSLGRARSHGCIRLRNIDAVELARILMIHGGDPRTPDWYQETLANATRSREVSLPRPIPVRVQA